MYERRFPKLPSGNYGIKQLRDMEGIRVREAYRMASKRIGVPWNSRKYKNTNWEAADEINRAFSQANAILYDICHAASR